MKEDAIISMARALGRAIQMDDRYKALEAVRKENDQDEMLQECIQQYSEARQKLSAELEKSARDETQIASLNADVQRLYEDIRSCAGMARYEEAKKAVEALFQYVSAIFSAAANGMDVAEVQQPEPCGGECAACVRNN